MLFICNVFLKHDQNQRSLIQEKLWSYSNIWSVCSYNKKCQNSLEQNYLIVYLRSTSSKNIRMIWHWLTYSTIEEYWSLIVTIDEQAQSMLEFVKICQVIPLSEADVERLFSQIGLIANKRRQAQRIQFGNYKEEQRFQVR
ncbi:Hypothetical_protein [Hexamita inflata]|uniref:Hypothetical_protein n=1 Tax=Hexamita inflata TaxID=28002 RepID=A0AA86U711_9EUKA|nr:Hypothetical protein HINF_LOCUS32925 [Hexamita inflata]